MTSEILNATDLQLLDRVQRRVLWLAVRMVDYANHERVDPSGMKVGGHQASSASVVSVMTALWFAHLGPEDRVAVKPHASPVLHAIQYLLGHLDGSYLRRLREFGGLQAYPSRTKDPDRIDFSTGSVGLGAVAPLFAAVTRRYVNDHFGERPHARFVALVGDAELDEGNVWEALADPATQGLGNVLWIVDLNRQSLDRVVPGIRAGRLERLFGDNGWNVIEAKYGGRLQEAFARPDGELLRRRLDDMPNEYYQSLFDAGASNLRTRFLAGGEPELKEFLADFDDDELAALLTNLGGHDIEQLVNAYRAADRVTDRPSVVFAYTVKGWGLPIAGDPSNHAALLSVDDIEQLRAACGLTTDDEWDRFAPESDEGRLCSTIAARLHRQPQITSTALGTPASVGLARSTKPSSTQENFGRLLTRLASDEGIGPHLVTTSPDVAVSTNLGGWINKVGVYSPHEGPDWYSDNRILRWRESPTGQHLELGISEMNLFMLLSQLGLAADHSGELLLPIGTVYDPFICRGLDALVYATYSGARFVIVGTPSGVALSAEGGAHQSTITASIGVELPGLCLCEPAYVTALDWLLCDALRRIGDLSHTPESCYLRLSTRPIDQAPFEAARSRLGDETMRSHVLAGGYRLVEPPEAGPVLYLCASGSVMPEVLEAAAQLQEEEVAAIVLDLTSISRLYRGWKAAIRGGIHAARSVADNFHLASLIPPAHRNAPIVTVHDAASHSMAWLGSVFGQRLVALGVDEFGQSGTISDLFSTHDLSPDRIVNAALAVLADDE